MIVAVIGGGASGMAAALAASEQPGARVVLFERQARLGRKLQATGNGRCNLTNLHAGDQGYHGDDPTFSTQCLKTFPPAQTLEWFRDMGLYTIAEPSGRVYPWSDQANSVTDILRFSLERSNIQILTGTEVRKVRRSGCGFRIEWEEDALECERLIIACGGLAGTKLGGSMSGYQLLRSLGHHCTRLRPALVQLKTSWPGVAALKGVRANCRARIFRDDSCQAESRGELQFTEYGLSGPVIFEISRDVCREPGAWECRLDLLPELTGEELISELLRRRTTHLPAAELFTGILHNRLGRVLVQSAGIGLTFRISDIPEESLRRAAGLAKDFRITITEPLGMESAQVTAGGICTGEFDAATMESRLVPGLFACGEVLDVDGDCGGYNLQWAWSSGRMAGTGAGKEMT